MINDDPKYAKDDGCLPRIDVSGKDFSATVIALKDGGDNDRVSVYGPACGYAGVRAFGGGAKCWFSPAK